MPHLPDQPAENEDHQYDITPRQGGLTSIIAHSGPANTLLKSTTLMPVSGLVADVL